MRWMLCDEQVPSENGEYLVTIPKSETEETVTVDRWTDGKWKDNSNVIAWRDLPKPYKINHFSIEWDRIAKEYYDEMIAENLTITQLATKKGVSVGVAKSAVSRHERKLLKAEDAIREKQEIEKKKKIRSRCEKCVYYGQILYDHGMDKGDFSCGLKYGLKMRGISSIEYPKIFYNEDTSSKFYTLDCEYYRESYDED